MSHFAHDSQELSKNNWAGKNLRFVYYPKYLHNFEASHPVINSAIEKDALGEFWKPIEHEKWTLCLNSRKFGTAKRIFLGGVLSLISRD